MREPPLLERQAVYWATGAMAGIASSAAVNVTAKVLPKTGLFPSPLTGSAIRQAALGAGMRFLVFDLCRDALNSNRRSVSLEAGTLAPPPTLSQSVIVLRGAISRCAGGLAEALQSSILASISTLRNGSHKASTFQPGHLASNMFWHGSTLFLCFGGYTLLTTTFSGSHQPPPAPLCFLLGGLAGAFGVPMVHILRSRSSTGLAVPALNGFVRVGTVIGCQVISSHRMLQYLERRQRLS